MRELHELVVSVKTKLSELVHEAGGACMGKRDASTQSASIITPTDEQIPLHGRASREGMGGDESAHLPDGSEIPEQEDKSGSRKRRSSDVESPAKDKAGAREHQKAARVSEEHSCSKTLENLLVRRSYT